MTIPREYEDSEVIRPLKSKFLIINIIATLISIDPMFIIANRFNEDDANKWLGIYVGIGVTIICLVSIVLYIVFYRKVKAFKDTLPKEVFKKEEQQILIDTKFRDDSIVVSHTSFVVVNMLILIAVIAITLINYDKIPDTIVMHYDFNGTPGNFQDKSLKSIMTLPSVMLSINIVFLISNIAIKKSKQKINPSKPKISIEQNKRFRYANSLLLFMTSISTSVLLGYIQMIMIFSSLSMTRFWMIFTVYMVLIIVGQFICL